jgi:hypothetical protein
MGLSVQRLIQVQKALSMANSGIVKRKLTIAITLSILLVILELAAHLYITLSEPGPEQPLVLYREWSSIKWVVGDYGGFIPETFHGNYYNFENGFRNTTDQPIHYNITLWRFGNSGMVDPAVKDINTVASHLQRLFNSYGYHVQVVNRAVSALRVNGELELLKQTPIIHGDIVLFIDGAMNAENEQCNLPLAILQVTCKVLPHQTRYDEAPDYFRTLAKAQNYTYSHRANFYHFLQPCAGWQSLTPLGMPILIPPEDFASYGSCHLLEAGDKITAWIIFDSITIF